MTGDVIWLLVLFSDRKYLLPIIRILLHLYFSVNTIYDRYEFVSENIDITT